MAAATWSVPGSGIGAPSPGPPLRVTILLTDLMSNLVSTFDPRDQYLGVHCLVLQPCSPLPSQLHPFLSLTVLGVSTLQPCLPLTAPGIPHSAPPNLALPSGCPGQTDIPDLSLLSP